MNCRRTSLTSGCRLLGRPRNGASMDDNRNLYVYVCAGVDIDAGICGCVYTHIYVYICTYVDIFV